MPINANPVEVGHAAKSIVNRGVRAADSSNVIDDHKRGRYKSSRWGCAGGSVVSIAIALGCIFLMSPLGWTLFGCFGAASIIFAALTVFAFKGSAKQFAHRWSNETNRRETGSHIKRSVTDSASKVVVDGSTITICDAKYIAEKVLELEKQYEDLCKSNDCESAISQDIKQRSLEDKAIVYVAVAYLSLYARNDAAKESFSELRDKLKIQKRKCIKVSDDSKAYDISIKCHDNIHGKIECSADCIWAGQWFVEYLNTELRNLKLSQSRASDDMKVDSENGINAHTDHLTNDYVQKEIANAIVLGQDLEVYDEMQRSPSAMSLTSYETQPHPTVQDDGNGRSVSSVGAYSSAEALLSGPSVYIKRTNGEHHSLYDTGGGNTSASNRIPVDQAHNVDGCVNETSSGPVIFDRAPGAKSYKYHADSSEESGNPSPPLRSSPKCSDGTMRN